jgi:hypothetical protein
MRPLESGQTTAAGGQGGDENHHRADESDELDCHLIG